MKAFTVSTSQSPENVVGEVYAGVPVQKDPFPHVLIGNMGPGRKATRLAIAKDLQENLGDVIPECDCITTKEKQTKLLVKVKDGPRRDKEGKFRKDKRALVYVALHGSLKSSSELLNDKLDPLTDEGEFRRVVIIGRGKAALGNHGTLGEFEEGLFTMYPGATIYCRRRGQLHGTPEYTSIHWDGEKISVAADESLSTQA